MTGGGGPHLDIDQRTICGTDLHILKGDVATCVPGWTRGHEGVGVVDPVGASVTSFRAGDRVLVSRISSCGKCEYCRRGMYSHCTTGGWILGNEIDGTQSECVRIPRADTNLYRIPGGVDEEAMVMLSAPPSHQDDAPNGRASGSRAKNRLIRAAGIIACLIFASAGCAELDPIRPTSGDYCIDEARGMLTARFGANRQIMQTRPFVNYDQWTLWATSDLCPGYFVFVGSGQETNESCTLAAYVSPPRSLAGMWGYGGCAALLPEGFVGNVVGPAVAKK